MGEEAPPQKSAKQLEKEAKKAAEKAAKLEKLAAKQAKQAEQKSKTDDDKKEKKPKKEAVVKESAKYDRDTKPGDKKDTSCPLPDAYSPQYVEVSEKQQWSTKNIFVTYKNICTPGCVVRVVGEAGDVQARVRAQGRAEEREAGGCLHDGHPAPQRHGQAASRPRPHQQVRSIQRP